MSEKKSKEIVVKNDQSPEGLIAMAIHQGTPVETMERLLVMRTQLRQEKAKELFDAAMAKFQSECPVISKEKIVMGKDKVSVRYKYAPLDSIISQVKTMLSDNGFSYSFDEEKDDKFASAICKITHISGHNEKSTFKIPIGTEDYMTDVQKYGARMTFAKRYAFCNAFGILTGDEDTDANETKDQQEDGRFKALVENAKRVSNIDGLKDARAKMEQTTKYTPEQKAEYIATVDARLKELEEGIKK